MVEYEISKQSERESYSHRKHTKQGATKRLSDSVTSEMIGQSSTFLSQVA